MSDYSYELPFSNDKLMKGIIMMLKKENKYNLANLLRGANVQIEKGGYSYYDGKWGRTTFHQILLILCLLYCTISNYFRYFTCLLDKGLISSYFRRNKKISCYKTWKI